MHKKTQREFAAELGVSVGTVANHENAKTEMPPSFWRTVLNNYGQNPTPPNPEEDPRQLLTGECSVPKVDDSSQTRSILAYMMRVRKRCIAAKEDALSPSRRFVDETINTVFLAATLIFVIEHVRRIFPHGVKDPDLYRDILFASSFVTIVALLIPVILSVPWGMKASLKN